MENKCIITGATGYIGSHLLRFLLERGWSVHIIADPKFGYKNIEDILNKIDVFEYDGQISKLINYFNQIKPDVVFHLAAAVITNYTSDQVPILIQSNIQFGTEILEAMKQSGTPLFVGTGSYWQCYNSEEYNPVDLYAATKEAYEKILKFYTETAGVRAITLRLFDVYGTGDNRPKLWSVLKKIAGTDQVLDLSPGGQLLDMVFISDVCSAYVQAFNLLTQQSNIRNEVYGVYTNNRNSLKNIVELYKTIIGKPVHVNYGGRPYKSREVMIPTDKLPIVPGWKPQIPVKRGLQMIVDDEVN